MKKFSKAQALVTAGITAATLAPAGLVHAADYDYGTTAVSATAATGFLAAWGIFMLVFVLLGVALFILWIVMLIDALQRKNWKDESQKNLWLIILIVSVFVGASPLAAIVYYFVIRKPLGKAKASQPEVAAAPAAAEPAEPAPKASSKK